MLSAIPPDRNSPSRACVEPGGGQEMQLKTLFAGLITLTIIGAPTLVRADEPGRHPSYLHARTDLRTAQMLMRVDDPDPRVMRNLREAAENVESAIHEIDRASVLDGKNLEDHPRVD